MCLFYLIVQWQQIYVAKLQKVNHTKIPPQTAFTDIHQSNMEFSCLHLAIITSRPRLPIFVFGHFSRFTPSPAIAVFLYIYGFLLRFHCHLPLLPFDFSRPWHLTSDLALPPNICFLLHLTKDWAFQCPIKQINFISVRQSSPLPLPPLLFLSIKIRTETKTTTTTKKSPLPRWFEIHRIIW